ncbi:Flp family type IVb pilin [Sporomusa sp. KB1]|uniref:Flp family type IVb pilin n=1 Tax=Sporomusa sp. KB1 TaxID=943346 RepID=UPI00119D35A1|nr:Flp family type IVb pilin [Sporomusa sp. KB1]TWH46824.1 pilus assembly protein Flp/PilA [Sporomusa sp. KB1]
MLRMYWEMFAARYLNEKGQGMVEYGLILALVAVGCILAFTNLGTAIGGKLTDATTELNK